MLLLVTCFITAIQTRNPKAVKYHCFPVSSRNCRARSQTRSQSTYQETCNTPVCTCDLIIYRAYALCSIMLTA